MTTKNAGKKKWADLDVHKTLPAQLDQLLGETDLGRLQSELSRLLPDLESHFKEEEEPEGLFAQLREDAPSSDPQVRQLEAEHKALLSALRELLTHVNEAVQLRGDIEEGKRAFIESLRSHHTTEEKVVLETYMRDVGGE